MTFSKIYLSLGTWQKKFFSRILLMSAPFSDAPVFYFVHVTGDVIFFTFLSVWIVRGSAFQIRGYSSSDWTKIKAATL